MYGSINFDDKYEIKLITTQCWLCGLTIEIRKGIPSYCSACLQENPKELSAYRKYLKGTQIADLFYE